jgi:8-oxo-dGTP diphosphatase
VAIGIVHHENEFLVGIRGPAGPLAGLAEFPGGKCLPGESPERCVIREVKEETGLDVIGCRLRAEKVHKYPHSLLRLSFFDCDSAGPAEPRAPFRWVSRQDLAGLKFPEANREIIRSLVAGLD